MRSHKQLFIIALAPSVAGLLLSGCGALTPAPVVDSKPDTRASSVTVGVPPPSAAESPRQMAMRPERASQMSERSPELLLQALATSGFDYRRGGQSHTSGFDCSGLVAHVFQQAYGVKLPHNSRAQSGYGKPIQVAELEIGDLVFFNTEQPFSHVGIYLGDNRFIHAPKPGAVVRTENITARYWTTRFNGARRILD